MRLLKGDAVSSVARVLDARREIVALDIGANTGELTRRMVEVFPKARVHAFEPAPDVFEALAKATGELKGVRRHNLAVGAKEGEVTLSITRDRHFSSVLPVSEVGKLHAGHLAEAERTVRVPMVSLDGWAQHEGVGRVDLIKIDVQGLELDVLRGAAGLIAGGVAAVICEAQLVAAYDGAATFSEIDRSLRASGLVLHQVHELWVQGPEQQTTCVDGLWLHRTALERLRERLSRSRAAAGARA